MNGAAWTKADSERLRTLYAAHGKAAFAMMPGRTPGACHAHAKRLGILQRNRVLWTAEEDAKLDRLWALHGWGCRNSFPGRTPDAVRSRARDRGLIAERPGATPRLRQKPRAVHDAPPPTDQAIAAQRHSAAVRRGLNAKAIAKVKAGVDPHSVKSAAERDALLFARRIVEAEQRAACPVEQAKTVLRRRYVPVVSMAYTAKGGRTDRYQVGNRLNLTEQDLLALAAEVAA